MLRRGKPLVPNEDVLDGVILRTSVVGPTCVGCELMSWSSPQGDAMAELVRTNDPVLLTVIEDVLASSGIDHHVADRNTSVLNGVIEVFQQRVLVRDEVEAEAREALVDAGLGEWLRP